MGPIGGGGNCCGKRDQTVTVNRFPATQLSPGKLTVSLRMTGLRHDGYHLIDAEMVSIDLTDELQFDEGDGLSIVMEGPATAGLSVEAGPTNLVTKALHLAGTRAQVTLRKRIPAGAGLGGGSSNAAAVLRWAGRTAPADIVASAALGADIPFCIVGGRARVTGIGEIVEALPFEARTFTLVLPPFGVSTPEVYRAWDQLGGPHGDHGNDLEPAALVVEPRLAQWRDRLGAATGIQPRLAGSGSTWFVDGAFQGDGLVVCHTIASPEPASVDLLQAR